MFFFSSFRSHQEHAADAQSEGFSAVAGSIHLLSACLFFIKVQYLLCYNDF